MRARLTFCAALVALAATPVAVQAAGRVALSSTVFVERQVVDARGQAKLVLEAPKRLTPGDRLVFLLAYRNPGTAPAADFVVTNPMPASVAFQGSPDANALVSIDGGASWGQLGALKVREPDGGVRGARPEDVTHVRWTLGRSIPAGAQGKLSFRGVVR